MCTGFESFSMPSLTTVMGAVGSGAQALGHLAGGRAAASFGRAQQDLAEADALYVEDAAQQQAQKILRAAQRQKSAARAATAASGVRLDEFALAPETEIETLAQEDAAMTILSGKRQGRSIRYGGAMANAAGQNERSASLFRAGNSLLQGLSGWKGAKGGVGDTKTVPVYENPEY